VIGSVKNVEFPHRGVSLGILKLDMIQLRPPTGKHGRLRRIVSLQERDDDVLLYNFVTIAETLIRSVLQELFVVTEI
jgi:hypothetical protein